MNAQGAAHTTETPPPFQVWAALGAIYLIWGSTYLAIRVMVETIPPLLGAGVRFLLAGTAMLAFLTARAGLQRVRISRSQLATTALIGTLLAAGGNGLVTLGEEHVPSGLAALLVASMPLWIVLYRTLLRDRVPTQTLVGVAVGFAGVALLLLPGSRPAGVPLGASLVVVAAGASWGLGSILAQRIELPSDGLVSAGWQMLWGGLVMTVAAVSAGEVGAVDPASFSTRSIAGFAYLVTIGSLVAYSAYAWLLQNAPISKVSTYAYVNPVVAVILGAVVLDEKIGAAMIAGTALIIAAVAAIVRRESGAAVRREPVRPDGPVPAAPPGRAAAAHPTR